jgi:hypothetical protein
MATSRDNSLNHGSDIPTRSPTSENWSGGILHTGLGSHFKKKLPVLHLLAANKIENPIFLY